MVSTGFNYTEVPKVAKWCANNGIEKLFIFGLMRSGLGNIYLRKHGEVPELVFDELILEVTDKFRNKLEIIHYKYTNNAECILLYSDGKIVIDPYHKPPNYQTRDWKYIQTHIR